MLRKRSRAVQSQSKGHLMPDSTSDSYFSSDVVAPKTRSSSFFSVPGLIVGYCTKGLSDSESTRSPTSPLEFRAFSNLGNSFARSPRSPGLEGQSRSWDCSRVGLGLVDSLNDETKPCGRVLGFSEGKNILLGSQMRINISIPKTHLDGLRDDPLGTAPKSLPKDYGISSQTSMGSAYCRSDCSTVGLGSRSTLLEHGEFGKIRSCSVDIGRSSLPLSRLMYHNLKSNSEGFSSDLTNSQSESPPLVTGGKKIDNFSGSLPIFGPADGFMGSLSASEIELSEDYTCIITHGPNPKTTHIFGNCILESHMIQSPDWKNKNGEEMRGSPCLVKCSGDSSPHPSCEFLSFCFSCKKKLEGKDINIHRGEKAISSCSCHDQEILIEEEMEKPTTDSPGSSFHEEIFLAGMVVAT